MKQSAGQSAVSIRRPSRALARFVSHYWLSLHNSDSTYTALPDGCVDIVLELTHSDWYGWVYGTTTRPTHIACLPGSHYLGIRFKPGQSRHFIRATAHELTDCCEDLRTLARFPTQAVVDNITSGALFSQLDATLTEMLRHSPPEANYIDEVIRHIEASHGCLRLSEVASQLGKSRRHLERVFRETVGIPAKLFSTIARLKHAADLIASPSGLALAEIAADAGYADQSHMTRDFARLAGTSPGRLLRDDVAFLQYHSAV